MHKLSPLLVAVGLLAPGCGDYCSKNYDKMKECASSNQLGSIPDKAEYVEKCQEEEKKAKDEGKFDEEDRKAQMECLDKSDCDEVKKCMSELSEKRYVKKQLEDIKAAGESDDIEKMKDACKYIGDDKTELVEACKPVLEKLAKAEADKAAGEMQALIDSGDAEKMKDACQYVSEDSDRFEACKPVMVKLLEVTTEQVTKMRDEGKHDFSVCGDLEGFAKSKGADAEAAAKALCKEAQASETVAKALTESAAKVKAKDADMPYECGAALKELAEIDSDWAKGKKTEVVKACFEDLGIVIMEAKVPGMKYVCDFRVKKVYEAVKEHKIENATMTEWMAKADPLCSKAG